MNARLKDIIGRVAGWPQSAQDELLQIALEIEAGLDEPYRATNAELVGIDRGLRDAAEGRFATDQQIEATFAKHRRP